MSHTVQHLRAALFRQIDALRSPDTATGTLHREGNVIRHVMKG